MNAHLLRSRLLCLLAAITVAAPSFAVAARVASTRTEAGNGYYVSGEVIITDSISGDLFAAGGRVTVLRAVGADAALAGGNVLVQTDVGQDLRVAGGNVSVLGAIGGDLAAAGGKVHIDEATTVGGTSFVAGGDITLDGRLARGAKLYANRIVIGGQVGGNTHLYAREISFKPSARIDGDLFYASAQPLQEDDLSKVSGRVLRERSPEAWEDDGRGSPLSWFHPFFFLSMLICGMVLYLLFPRAISGVRDTIANAPLRSMALGLALLFTLPPVGMLLIMTLVGIPLGLGLFAVYPLILLLGYLATAFLIGQKIAHATRHEGAHTRRRQALYLAGALLLLGIAGAVPVLGWLVMFLALVAGIGGWAIWGMRRYRGAEAPGAAA